MNEEKEFDINESVNDEIVEENSMDAVEKVENVGEDAEEISNSEEPAEDSEENKLITEEEFISEFAPSPIKIPNYNKEKARMKAQKTRTKSKKAKSRAAKRRKRMMRKVLATTRTVFFFVLIFLLTTNIVMSMMVKLGVSKYSIESAIQKSNPETFIIGEIKSPTKINLQTSSPEASIADILRDNKMSSISVTYADIKEVVKNSTFSSFVAQVANDVVSYYVYGDKYEGIAKKDIADVIYENASYIKVVTGVELGQSACEELGEYISKSAAFKEISHENITSQSSKLTAITSVLFSTYVLLALIILFAVFVVLTITYSRESWHKIVGFAIMLSGFAVGLIGFLFKPAFSAETPFIKCVLAAIVNGFNKNSIIYASVTIFIGVLAFLIGKAISDDDEDDEYLYEDELLEENAQ